MSNKATPASTPGKEVRYSILPDRMPAIPIEEMSKTQRQAAAEILRRPARQIRRSILANNTQPGFMEHMQKVGAYFRYAYPLDGRINQMAALMTARSWTQQLVWDVHINQALEAGLEPAVADAIAEGRLGKLRCLLAGIMVASRCPCRYSPRAASTSGAASRRGGPFPFTAIAARRRPRCFPFYPVIVPS
jgi:hypothetical protein